MMKLSTQLTLWTACLTVAASFLSVSAVAETANILDSSQGYQSNERDAFTGDMGGGSFNPMDLMHNLRLRGRSMDDYVGEQQQQLDSARENFLQQRQQMLRNYKPNSATQAETESNTEE